MTQSKHHTLGTEHIFLTLPGARRTPAAAALGGDEGGGEGGFVFEEEILSDSDISEHFPSDDEEDEQAEAQHLLAGREGEGSSTGAPGRRGEGAAVAAAGFAAVLAVQGLGRVPAGWKGRHVLACGSLPMGFGTKAWAVGSWLPA